MSSLLYGKLSDRESPSPEALNVRGIVRRAGQRHYHREPCDNSATSINGGNEKI